MGICHYCNTSFQGGHLLPIETHHTVLVKLVLYRFSVILILLANRLTYFNTIHQEYYIVTHSLVGL